MAQNEHFIKDIPAAISQFPELRQIEKNGVTILTGQLPLYSDEGEELDSYMIEIHPSNNYPNSYPLVYEIGGKIPNNLDWHIYPGGECCLAVPAEERLDCVAGINLTSFIKKQVIGYFFNQTFRRKNGYFYRERAHGLPGKLQFYIEYFRLKDFATVLVALKIIATGHEQGSHSKCFCGSKRKFKKCHRRQLRQFGRKAGDIVRRDYNELKVIANHARNQTNKK